MHIFAQASCSAGGLGWVVGRLGGVTTEDMGVWAAVAADGEAGVATANDLRKSAADAGDAAAPGDAAAGTVAGTAAGTGESDFRKSAAEGAADDAAAGDASAVFGLSVFRKSAGDICPEGTDSGAPNIC